MKLSRRHATALCASAVLAPRLARAAEAPLLKRPIPHSGEMLPAVGLGTAYYNYAAGDRAGAAAVISALLDHGGTLVDTAISYQDSEAVIGDVMETQKLRSKIFLATKLEKYSSVKEADEVQTSLTHLKTSKLDLLQLHNVRDPNQSLAGLKDLKAKGTIRYHGITTTFPRSYDAAEAVIKREKPDFFEIDYAIDNRVAEQRLLPAAMDAGSAVLVALPLGRGKVFSNVRDKPLPDFAAEIDCTSWAHFFLKFILGHPAITAVIPGTGNPEHIIDDLGAARGRIPDAKMRDRMAQYVASL